MYPILILFSFFFNDTATTEIYTLSLHDALPISRVHFAAGVAEIATRHPRDPLREFVGTLRQVLGEIVQDLAAIVAARLRPTVRGVRRLDRIADVLAVPLRDLGEQRP